MESATFRKWLADRGCHFDYHEHQQRGKGQMMVTVHREGRKTEVPLGGSRQNLEQRVVHRACEELGLDPSQLPGPQTFAPLAHHLDEINAVISHPLVQKSRQATFSRQSSVIQRTLAF